MEKTDLLKQVIADKENKVRLYFAWYAFYWTVNLAGLSLIGQLALARQAILMFVVLTFGSMVMSGLVFGFVIQRNSDIRLLASAESKQSPLSRPWFEYTCGAITVLSFAVLLGVWIWLAIRYWNPPVT